MQPVAILSAVFWVTWSLFRFVSLMIGDQIVLPYSMIGLTVALYVVIRVSFCFPHVVPFKAFKILMFLSAFSFVLFTWFLKVYFGSRVSPRILRFLTVGMIVLLMVKSRIVLNSAWCGVKSVAVDLSGLSISSFESTWKCLPSMVAGCFELFYSWHVMRLDSCRLRK